MENTYIQQLDYTAQTSQNVPAKRKILDYYCKIDHEKERKTKFELFTIQNIKGLLTVIQINPSKLQFLSFEEVCSELTLFLQNAKRVECQSRETFKISEQKFIILMEGIIMKKNDLLSLSINQIMITQTIFNKNRKSGITTKPKQKNFPSVLNNIFPQKKSNVRKIITNEHLSPKAIYFSFIDNKQFQCCCPVVYLEFPLISLETFQNRIDLKEKQCIANFVQVCLGVQNKKAFLRVVPKLQRVNISCNRQFFGAFKTIYMVYKGQIVLHTQKYQISLNKNGVIYKQQGFQFYIVSKNPQTLIFSIEIAEIIQIFKELNNDTLQQIILNLKNLDHKRDGLLQRLERQAQDQQLIEPIFDTQILNLKSFEKKNQETQPKEDINNRKYFIPKSACQIKSSRIRHHQQINKQNTLHSDLSIFLSNYPYVKIVQSQIKAHQILKTGMNEKSIQRKMAAYQKFTDEQKKKVEKDRKKFYYMDKVRKMKIKNIAQREIPNGHKKNFKMDEAEKQISQYTLFKNIIEYPMNGVSQNATKQSKNKKKIQKLVRMCTINSKIQRRTSGNNINFCENIDYKCDTNDYEIDLDSLSSKSGDSPDKQNSNNNIKQQQIVQDELVKESIGGNSFYWTNILNPHLPTQKQMKIKRKRLSSNKILLQFQNENKFWEQKQHSRKELSRNRQMKYQKSPKSHSFQRSYKRIKTTLH